MPSAMVRTPIQRAPAGPRPARRPWPPRPAASTPTTRTSGRLDGQRGGHARRSARRRRPGTSTVVGVADSSASSSPSVPWPAMTSRSSNGRHEVASPGVAAWPRPRRCASSTLTPDQAHLGPVGPGRLHLGQRRARSGMHTIAERPSSEAARATPWAWFPAERGHHAAAVVGQRVRCGGRRPGS